MNDPVNGPDVVAQCKRKYLAMENEVLAAQEEYDYQRKHGSGITTDIARYNVQNAVRRLNEYLDKLDRSGIQLPED